MPRSLSSVQRVIWLDPGPVTGWANIELATGRFSSGQLAPLLLGEFLRRYLADSAVGWEDYTIRPGSARVTFHPESLEVIGMVRWLAHESDALVFPATQPESRAIGLRLLKPAGWHRPGQGHANDAAAHLLSQLIARGLTPQHLSDVISAELAKIGTPKIHGE